MKRRMDYAVLWVPAPAGTGDTLPKALAEILFDQLLDEDGVVAEVPGTSFVE